MIFSKKDGHISYIQKDYNEFKLQYNKQSVEVLNQQAVKRTLQILYDKGLFLKYANVAKVFRRFFYHKA